MGAMDRLAGSSIRVSSRPRSLKDIPMTRRRRVAAAVAIFVTLGLARPGSSAQAAQGSDLSGLHAFDLRVGKWKLHNRVLKARLAGSHEWLEYGGVQTWRSILNGQGNVDDTRLDKPSGAYSGATLRAYDPKTGQWALWWLDGRTPTAKLDPPMLGRFVGGVGTFYNDDSLRGKPIKVRFIWSKITRNSAHWEQAYSPDGGKTWETNWITDFTRVG
jgi:hypothetical protein